MLKSVHAMSRLSSAINTHNEFEYLTSLRGIAAVIVLLSHIVQVFWLRYETLPTWVHTISSMSSLFAVKVFFVLSGFLIAHSIEQNSKKNEGVFDIKNYLAARFARIYPPFLYSVGVSLVIFATLFCLNMPGVSVPLKFSGDLYSAREYLTLSKTEVFLSLMMVQGLLEINGPLWSLYIEVKLYIIYMFFYLVVVGKNKYLASTGFLFVTYLALKFNPDFLRYAVIWIVGCMAYYFFIIRNTIYDKKFLACLFLVFLINLYDIMGRFIEVPHIYTKNSLILMDLLLSVFISVVILLFKFKNPFTHQAGLLSYSLYVVHFPVILFIQSVIVSLDYKSLLATFCASFIAFFAALFISYYGGLIEKKKGIIQGLIIENYKKLQ